MKTSTKQNKASTTMKNTTHKKQKVRNSSSLTTSVSPINDKMDVQDILFENNIKDDLYFAYSDLNNEENEKYWIDYYKKNYDSKIITDYYSKESKSQDVLDKIIQSAQDTANGFIQLIKISKEGTTYVKEKCELEDIIKGVCFIKNISGKIFDSSNILMTVGVFTSKKAAFFVMCGVCTGFNYTGIKEKNLSSILFKNIATIMKEKKFFFFKEKISFITRPLEKMGTLLKSDNRDELSIPFDENRKINNANANTAIAWLKECNDYSDSDGSPNKIDLYKIRECIGDICFLRHFVLEVFSPKWGYTGKRIENLIKGGQLKLINYTIKKLQEFAKILNISYIGKKKSILINDIVNIELKYLNIYQIKKYCKFLNIIGYSKYKTKTNLILFIKKRKHY
jgi:hypothetical protein